MEPGPYWMLGLLVAVPVVQTTPSVHALKARFKISDN